MATAAEIRQGMIDRGIAPHIADAFILNFQDESGLNPSITEAVPNVHGTRGRGLYQLTGPRRDAYEARYGDAYDVDSQLDWMMHELQGPEARAAERIFSAPDTGSAAAAIVTHFLRPAAQHRDSRVARYTGGAMPSYGEAPQGRAGTRGPNALAQQPRQPDMNALAMMEMLRPPELQSNALNVADFLQPVGMNQMVRTF